MKTLRRDFGGDFSSSAFRLIDGEPNIVGKYGRISQHPDGEYDVWFVPADVRRGHSGRRIARLRKACGVELDGEGYARGHGRDFVLRMAPLAGVKRKRRLSSEQKARQAAILAKARERRLQSGMTV